MMVLNILRESFSSLFCYMRSLNKALIGPLILALAAELLTLTLSMNEPFSLFFYYSAHWFAEFISLVSYTLLAIIVIQTVLQDNVNGFGFGLFWRKRETRFLLHQLGLIALLIPVSFLGFIPGIGSWLVMLMAGYLFSRFALVFPGIALNQGITFRVAWKLSQRYQLSVFTLAALLPGIGMVITDLLLIDLYSLPLKFILDFVLSVFFIIAMALLYRNIVLRAASQN
ncbi:hypothetical protein HW452_14260 [Halomonas aquamarina]|uniref:Uncharacterized protein n=1 Tax=Vreelandella aquamarina TaxID=77097 RepID=A0ACC5VX76_9GAMM|nr:hypothetical protein [Halomonas aquamarina]MBZ5488687.1 hypothetical protein [Halomonas aquamarina]